MPIHKDTWLTARRIKFNNYVLSWTGTFMELCSISQRRLAKESGCGYVRINENGGICLMLQEWRNRAERKIQDYYDALQYDTEYNRRLKAVKKYLDIDPDIFLFIYKYKSLSFSESVMKIFEPIIDHNHLQKWRGAAFYFIWNRVNRYLLDKNTSVDNMSDKDKVLFVQYMRDSFDSSQFDEAMEKYTTSL